MPRCPHARTRTRRNKAELRCISLSLSLSPHRNRSPLTPSSLPLVAALLSNSWPPLFLPIFPLPLPPLLPPAIPFPSLPLPSSPSLALFLSPLLSHLFHLPLSSLFLPHLFSPLTSSTFVTLSPTYPFSLCLFRHLRLPLLVSLFLCFPSSVSLTYYNDMTHSCHLLFPLFVSIILFVI